MSEESLTKQIQRSVCKHLCLMNHESICENYGHNWEMDVASLSKSGMLHEYEVKISRSDFMADKKRKSTKFAYYEQGNEKCSPNYFYYVCPKDLIKTDEIPIWAGLYYFENGEIYLVRNCKRIHKKPIQDIEKVLRKMIRLNVQRNYLGGSMLTYLNKEANRKHAEYLEREKQNKELLEDKYKSLFPNT